MEKFIRYTERWTITCQYTATVCVFRGNSDQPLHKILDSTLKSKQ